MEIFKKFGLLLYWITVLLDCTFLMIEEPELRWVTRIFSIPLLFLYLFANSTKKHHRRNYKYFFYAALLFGWLSEVLSLVNGSDSIKYAIVALLAMHVCYALFFYSVKSFKDNSLIIFFAAVAIITAIEFGLYRCFGSYFVAEKPLVLIALCIVGISIALAANVLTSSVKKRLAIKYFVPGMLLISFSYVCLLTYNFFLQKELFVYICVLLFTAIGQSLLVEGEKKII